MLSTFQLEIKFDFQFFAVFQSFFFSNLPVFDELAPPPTNKRFKICFKSFFWVYSSAKDSVRSAAKAVFFLFSILVGRPIGGTVARPLATLSSACDVFLTSNAYQ